MSASFSVSVGQILRDYKATNFGLLFQLPASTINPVNRQSSPLLSPIGIKSITTFMAALASERVSELSFPVTQSVDRTPSKRVSDASVSDAQAGSNSPSSDALDRSTSLNRSLSSSRQLDSQDQSYLRSEEYRQLFRLPPEEVLVQDFNCALQENFLLQGHMYLFAHYICFYSNLFGFETKKIISFYEISSVRRAKAAVLFPTAIEIIAGGKKYFFTSFLSRDEAFKIINDGWLQHGNGAKLISDQQDPKPAVNSQENGSVIVEEAVSFSQLGDGPDLLERNNDASTLEDLNAPVNAEIDVLSTSDGLEGNVVGDIEILQSPDISPPGKSLVWVGEESAAPGVPECYTKVAESKFPVKVEEFFQFFFSDDAVDFQDAFHRKCGDKDFRCTKWSPHEIFGYTRDVSFQHPIKLYLGAKFGGCRELQRYRVYRNSHLVIDTSQEIDDVPYGDYFRVEGLWHVEKADNSSNSGCILRVYTNVNFSKSTMFKGKIVQSTVDECRDAYASWIKLAHEMLKQKNLEVQENPVPDSDLIRDKPKPPGKPKLSAERPGVSKEPAALSGHGRLSKPEDVDHLSTASVRGSRNGATVVAHTLRDSALKLFSTLRSQNNISFLLIISITVILLIMQMSILVLLSRPQQVHVIPQADFRSVGVREVEFSLVDKQIKHLKEELHFVETLLDKMQSEYALLKLNLKDLELLRSRQR